MRIKRFLQITSNLFAENRVLKFVLAGTLVINVSCFIMLYFAVNSRITVLVPPVMNSRVVISGDVASDSYVRELARYISGLAFSFSPGTAWGQFNELLSLYSPTTMPEEKKIFYSLADTVVQTKTTTSFYIHGIKHDIAHKVIEVQGALNTYLDLQPAGSAEKKVYIIEYTMKDGRFMILRIREKKA